MIEWKPQPSKRVTTYGQAAEQAPRGWRLPTGEEITGMIRSRSLQRSGSYWTSRYHGPDSSGSTRALAYRCLVENGQLDQMDATSADNNHEGTVAWYCRDT